MNSPAYFELQAEDPARAVAFYRAVFGWQATEVDGLPVELWRAETPDGIDGGILKRPAGAPPKESGTNAAVISMQVENYDATAEAIIRNGGLDGLPKFAVPGRCWQGYFLDTEGNAFGIYGVDPGAKQHERLTDGAHARGEGRGSAPQERRLRGNPIVVPAVVS